jgi:hypothetical protein
MFPGLVINKHSPLGALQGTCVHALAHRGGGKSSSQQMFPPHYQTNDPDNDNPVQWVPIWNACLTPWGVLSLVRQLDFPTCLLHICLQGHAVSSNKSFFLSIIKVSFSTVFAFFPSLGCSHFRQYPKTRAYYMAMKPTDHWQPVVSNVLIKREI